MKTFKIHQILLSLQKTYLALIALVCTNTFTQGVLANTDVHRFPQIAGAEDTLAVLQVFLEWADIGLVNIVYQNRGHSDDLRGASRHDGHQDEEEHGVLSSRPQQLLGHQWSGEAGGDILVSQQGSSLGRGQSKVGQALTQS